ncbi:hypothetical protein IR010_03350 [Flavobacterium sp. MR2016-29]|uniref:hypothetical protein n=1 Tax=Flavobacterium sp. MR2016-29 TaxID=2783795 RepID=UPI00188B89CE|nr:hypothetical protein [Flavobacterium sp. MR2016-29]MBF4491563.1 hypothetical protein [Flavobacterium sp. MR2016-29]
MKSIHIFLIVLFGILLMPGNSFACEKNSIKHSCKKEISSKTCNDDCCNKDSHSKAKKHQGCGSKCNHSKCCCASSSNTLISITEWNSNSNRFNFSSKKQNFYNLETSISSGFNSLWFIPKIS